MVLLGGLEIVAAGYIINELHKDGKAAEKDERRHGSEHRKPHRRRDSRHRPHHGSQQLHPPSNSPQRPLSAPPPASRPMWQPQQQGPIPPIPQRQPQYYNQPPPMAMMQHQQHQSTPPPIYHASPPLPPSQNQRPTFHQQQSTPPHPQAIHYPPPGQYIDLKTGKVQNNMYPPDMQPPSNNNNGSSGTGRGLSFDEASKSYTARNSSTSSLPTPSPEYGPQQFHNSKSTDSPLRPQITRNPVSSPPLGYAELDAETPGRYRPYEKGSQQAFPSSGLGQRVMSVSSPPPRSESGFYDGNGSVASFRSPPPSYRA